jgi:hypothetical protein
MTTPKTYLRDIRAAIDEGRERNVDAIKDVATRYFAALNGWGWYENTTPFRPQHIGQRMEGD